MQFVFFYNADRTLKLFYLIALLSTIYLLTGTQTGQFIASVIGEVK